MAGARVDVAPYKKGPMDFVLWKPSGPDLAGMGKPLSRAPGLAYRMLGDERGLLGETFDIHGGGIDLVFPHHENEIAQSEGAHMGCPFAKLWMANGFLQVEGQKMSKSLGNFVTINDARQREHPEVLRLQMLMTHYRQPIDWTEVGRQQARSTLNHWYQRTEGFGVSAEVLISRLLLMRRCSTISICRVRLPS
ncbi:MAG: class I tRNA ligase family protein [Alphaproteobacteria bacterium]